ncbi:MAG: hypothetical protein MAG451_02389 [Anaerolineales bacterium]|nr:hypothetical protein [Anaerolineales bacterium]
MERVIQNDNIPGGEVQGLHGFVDRDGHRAQMHRNVGRLSDHATFCVEEGAREISPFLDVGRVAGAPQHHAHFFGDGGEQVFEDFESDWVIHGIAYCVLLCSFTQ